MVALDARFLDRFFDLHMMTLVQHAVGAAMPGDPVKRQEELAHTEQKLEMAHAWLEEQLVDKI